MEECGSMYGRMEDEDEARAVSIRKRKVSTLAAPSRSDTRAAELKNLSRLSLSRLSLSRLSLSGLSLSPLSLSPLSPKL